MRKLATVMTVLAVAACGEVRWAKPGADSATLADDHARCQVMARDQLARTLGPPVPALSDPRFGGELSGPSPADRQMQEQSIASRCMREKGYALVPAEK